VINTIVYKCENFNEKYKIRSGKDWPAEHSAAIYERLNKCNFDLDLLLRVRKNQSSLSDQEKFFRIIARGDFEKVKMFLPVPYDGLNTKQFKKVKDEHHKTGLHIASQFGHADIAEYLIQHGCDLEAIDNLERTPLHYAAMTGDCVEVLLKLRAKYLVQDKLYRTPSHYTAMNNNCQQLKLFLMKDHKLVHAKDSFGMTLLHYAVLASGDVLDMVELLLKYRADVNVKDLRDQSAIFYACKSDKKVIVEYLLERGADIPGITSRKYNKLFLKYKFKEFHQPRMNLTLTQQEMDKLAGNIEEGIDDQSMNSERVIQNKMLSDIGDRADEKWKDTYLKHRVAQTENGRSDRTAFSDNDEFPESLRKTLRSNYEFDQEEDSDMRSTALTEETAKQYYADEIANLKILVHILNQKLESTSFDHAEQIDELLRLREDVKHIDALRKRNEEILKDNTTLQNKLDELMNTTDLAFDKIDKLTKQLEERDAQLSDKAINDELVKKYTKRISQLQDEIASLKKEMAENKQKADELYKDLQRKLQQEKEENSRFSVDYFVIGRFIRILEKETLSHFRIRLKNQDSKDSGTLKYDKVKKVISDVGVIPMDLPNLMRLAGFYEEDDVFDEINIGKWRITDFGVKEFFECYFDF